MFSALAAEKVGLIRCRSLSEKFRPLIGSESVLFRSVRVLKHGADGFQNSELTIDYSPSDAQRADQSEGRHSDSVDLGGAVVRPLRRYVMMRHCTARMYLSPGELDGEMSVAELSRIGDQQIVHLIESDADEHRFKTRRNFNTK
jgi:hypothetical protein